MLGTCHLISVGESRGVWSYFECRLFGRTTLSKGKFSLNLCPTPWKTLIYFHGQLPKPPNIFRWQLSLSLPPPTPILKTLQTSTFLNQANACHSQCFSDASAFNNYMQVKGFIIMVYINVFSQPYDLAFLSSPTFVRFYLFYIIILLTTQCTCSIFVLGFQRVENNL